MLFPNSATSLASNSLNENIPPSTYSTPNLRPHRAPHAADAVFDWQLNLRAPRYNTFTELIIILIVQKYVVRLKFCHYFDRIMIKLSARFITRLPPYWLTGWVSFYMNMACYNCLLLKFRVHDYELDNFLSWFELSYLSHSIYIELPISIYKCKYFLNKPFRILCLLYSEASLSSSTIMVN